MLGIIVAEPLITKGKLIKSSSILDGHTGHAWSLLIWVVTSTRHTVSADPPCITWSCVVASANDLVLNYPLLPHQLAHGSQAAIMSDTKAFTVLGAINGTDGHDA